MREDRTRYFEAPAATPGSVSTVLSNLIIDNRSVQANVINNVLIQGNLSLYAFGGGFKELDMLGTQVKRHRKSTTTLRPRQYARRHADFLGRLLYDAHELCFSKG